MILSLITESTSLRGFVITDFDGLPKCLLREAIGRQYRYYIFLRTHNTNNYNTNNIHRSLNPSWICWCIICIFIVICFRCAIFGTIIANIPRKIKSSTQAWLTVFSFKYPLNNTMKPQWKTTKRGSNKAKTVIE